MVHNLVNKSRFNGRVGVVQPESVALLASHERVAIKFNDGTLLRLKDKNIRSQYNRPSLEPKYVRVPSYPQVGVFRQQGVIFKVRGRCECHATIMHIFDVSCTARACLIVCVIVSQDVKNFFFHMDDMKAVLKEHYAKDHTIMQTKFGIKINIRGAGWRDHTLSWDSKVGHAESASSRRAWESFFDDFEEKLWHRIAPSPIVCECFFCHRMIQWSRLLQDEEEEARGDGGEEEKGFASIASLLPKTPSWQKSVSSFFQQ